MNDLQTPETPSWKQRAIRWWYILRYYHKSQLVMRLVSVLRRRLLRLTGGRRYLRPLKSAALLRENPGFESLLTCKLAARRAGGAALDAANVLEGKLRFLNEQLDLSDPIDWRVQRWTETPLLWRFHLHYHEFLLDLAAEGLRSGESAWFDRTWDRVADWIERNRLDDARGLVDAWHPYCISRRLPVWILLWSASPPTGTMADRVLHSMACQARFLQRNLEWDLRGNHLLENARALVLMGSFFKGPHADRWLRKGTRVFRREIAQQVLPHGEHFERSPMYHALMLEAVLDVRDATASVLPELADFCIPLAEKMAAFLEQICHPDGRIPLLGDACFGESAPVGQLIARAAGNGVEKDLDESSPGPLEQGTGVMGNVPAPAIRLGDYWIYRQNTDFLLFDAGPLGPDFLPAHAHADLLSFEASIQGRRVFVDSGVFNYQDDAMRRYCRGSAAHNVLVVDDQDHCDVWSRFRMGYRGWPFGLVAGEAHGFRWARAHHDAYRRLGVPVVGRWMACRPGGPWFCIDWAEGSGSHKFTSRLHVHPDAEAEQTDTQEIRIRCGEVILRLRTLAPGRLDVTTGHYCPELGCRLECPVVQWTATATLPTVCGWHLTWGENLNPASMTPFAAKDTVLHWDESGRSVSLWPIGKT